MWAVSGLTRQAEQNRPEGRAMQNQSTTPASPKTVPVPQYPNLAPRPEQSANPNAQRQQEQAQQQVQQ
jgi:hypothetical protein